MKNSRTKRNFDRKRKFSSGATVFIRLVRTERDDWVWYRHYSVVDRVSAKARLNSLDQSVSNVGIDGACAALFVFLWKKDEEAKQKQMSRIGREERLGGLKVELDFTGKSYMQSLRGFSRESFYSADLEYLEKSLEVAEEYKDELIKKGVFLVPVAMDDEAATKLNKPDNAKKDERRFRGSAVNVSQKDGWRD